MQFKGLRSLLQHHSSKTSVLWCSIFFMVQLSHPYRTTGKTIALTRWTFVNKEMSLLFNIQSRFVIAFLPRSKHLLICRTRILPRLPLLLRWKKGSSPWTDSKTLCSLPLPRLHTHLLCAPTTPAFCRHPPNANFIHATGPLLMLLPCL